MNPDTVQFERYWRKRISDEIESYYNRLANENDWDKAVAFGVDIAKNVALMGSLNEG